MFTPTTDYNQQLFAYLQTWRQLLEQWAAMMAGLPFPTAPSVWPTVPFMPAGGQFMPPAAPFMPPMPPLMPPTPTAPAPPMPPAPADYTQQLFSYLQAWRQYLEQMTGARPGSPQQPTTQPPTAQPASDGAKARPTPPPDVPIPPGDDTGSEIRWPPPLVGIPPYNEYVSEFRRPGSDQPSGHGLEEPQLLNPPDYAFGYRDRPRPGTFPAGAVVYTAEPEASRYTSEAPAQLPVNSPFSAVMERVEPSASPQSAPRSLFSSPGAQTASARAEEAGQKPSP